MKLRNKKTGEVVKAMFYAPIGKYTLSIWKDTDYLDPTSDNHRLGVYESLTELNEEWEDYAPAEPLIKDEKIRKAVRAWADINGIDKKVEYNTYISDGSCSFVFTYDGGGAELLLDFRFLIDTLKGGKYYTIDELCGEEE